MKLSTAFDLFYNLLSCALPHFFYHAELPAHQRRSLSIKAKVQFTVVYAYALNMKAMMMINS
jgi:hypothetical protein